MFKFEQAIDYLVQHRGQRFTTHAVAAVVGTGPEHLCRSFKWRMKNPQPGPAIRRDESVLPYEYWAE